MTKISPEMKQRMFDVICLGTGKMFVPAGIEIEVTEVCADSVRLRVIIVDREGRDLVEICKPGPLFKGDTVTLLDVNRAFDITVER